MSEIIEKLRQTFIETMGGEGRILYFFAPGRVNLIGETYRLQRRTCISLRPDCGTYGAARKRTDKKLRFFL